mmetsp:Transcript_3470/g.8374  ORF Transcript_3470/g.8374 Transcript_3470/m.8374 type:complete len:405 (+) Transcript_3470:397-1611(+)
MRAVHRFPPCEVSTLSSKICNDSTGSPGGRPGACDGEGASRLQTDCCVLAGECSRRRSHKRSEASTESTSSSSAPRLYPPPERSFQPCEPMHVTEPLCPCSVCSHRCVLMSHSLILWSREPLNITDGPKGVALPRERQWTEREWPMKVAVHFPPACRSHSLIVWSTEPESSAVPSSLASRHMTAASWRIIGLICSLFSRCTSTPPASPPETTTSSDIMMIDWMKSWCPVHVASLRTKCGRLLVSRGWKNASSISPSGSPSNGSSASALTASAATPTVAGPAASAPCGGTSRGKRSLPRLRSSLRATCASLSSSRRHTSHTCTLPNSDPAASIAGPASVACIPMHEKPSGGRGTCASPGLLAVSRLKHRGCAASASCQKQMVPSYEQVTSSRVPRCMRTDGTQWR